jgi:hypothetical protein
MKWFMRILAYLSDCVHSHATLSTQVAENQRCSSLELALSRFGKRLAYLPTL